MDCFNAEYWKNFIKESLESKDYTTAARLMLTSNLVDQFEVFETIKELLKIGKADVCGKLINSTSGDRQKQLIRNVVIHCSNDKYLKFAQKLSFDYKLNMREYPDLDFLLKSNHFVVNRAFIDPSKSEYVQLHVMEDLIDGDRRLLKKLFYSLIKILSPNYKLVWYNIV